MKEYLKNAISFGLLGPKRPPGPSLFELQDEPLQDEAYANLEYPLKLSQKYGDFCYISAANQYVVTGPEGFQHILKRNAQNYTKQNYYYHRIRSLFGHSLLTGDGNYWKRRRNMVRSAFQHAMIKTYVPHILQGTDQFIHQWNTASRQNTPVNILTLMNHLTLGIALQLFAGETLAERTVIKLSQAIYFANHYVSHTLFISPWKPTPNSIRFHWHMKVMHDILGDLLESHRQKTKSPENNDVKNLLSILTDSTLPEEERPLQDQEILNEFKTLLLTGHETTGCALAWTWYLLAANPEWREALEQELAEKLGGRPPSLQDLPLLPVLHAIFQETLRLYPPIWSFARTNLEADELYGYTLPSKSLIVLNLYALHRNPRYWENPEVFNPGRFLGDTTSSLSPYTFLPFSTGPRTCIASRLGTEEALLIIATLAQYCRFDLCSKTRIRLEPCISLRPRQGLWLKISAKER